MVSLFGEIPNINQKENQITKTTTNQTLENPNVCRKSY